jgi:hypothetical protein
MRCLSPNERKICVQNGYVLKVVLLLALLMRAARNNQQPRQMLLNTSLIRCSLASSSACSWSNSGVPRFGHGLVDRATEPVMSTASERAAGCTLAVATAGSGETSCLTRCGCWDSARGASGRDAQPPRLAPIPINKRAVPNRIIRPTIRRACDDTSELRLHPHVLEHGSAPLPGTADANRRLNPHLSKLPRGQIEHATERLAPERNQSARAEKRRWNKFLALKAWKVGRRRSRGVHTTLAPAATVASRTLWRPCP